MSSQPAEPQLALASPPSMRRGWFMPTRPGPSLRTIMLAVGAGVIALAAWLVFVIDAQHHIDPHGKRVERTLQIDDAGQLRVDDKHTQAARQYRGVRSLRYAAVRAHVPMPASAARMRIDLALPAGVQPEDAVLRARTPAAVVQLRRTKDDAAPYADITRVRSGEIDVDVLVAVPAEGLLVNETTKSPPLSNATKPFDEHVVAEAASGRRLARLHRSAGWFVGIAVLLGMLLPIGLVLQLRRRWYHAVPELPVASAPPAGPPSTLAVVTAAAITRGARGVSVPNAFAAQVLDLVARDSIKLRHTLDPRTGEGAAIGIGAARGSDDAASHDPTTLDGAALLVLEAVADEAGDTVQLPDRAERLTEQLALVATYHGRLHSARTAWRAALEHQLTAVAVVEHVRTRYLSFVTLIVGLLLIAGLGMGIAGDLDGTRATGWLFAASALAPTILLGVATFEQRGWVRVRSERRAERLRWLAWRAVLDEQAAGSGSVDVRVLPYAVATGKHAGIAPRRAGPTDVGLAAATPELIRSLRRVAGASE